MCGGVIKPGPDGLLYICIRGGALEECARGPGQRTGLGFHTPKSGGFVPFPRVHLVLTTLSFRARCFWCSRATFPPCGDGRYINIRYTALGIAVSCSLTDLIVLSLLAAWWATSCHNTRVRASRSHAVLVTQWMLPPQQCATTQNAALLSYRRVVLRVLPPRPRDHPLRGPR